VGEIKITEINKQTYSGEFTFELVKCNDFYSSKNIAEIPVPFTATGTFKKISYKNHLEELMNKRN
jgi:Tfp pilus assembly protein PilO